jgi:hypothetical protein
MFAKLARRLTNGRKAAPPHRSAAALRLVVNGELKVAKRPHRGERTLVCRWRALPGCSTLACAWQIEVAAGCGQQLRPTQRLAAVLVAGDDSSGRRLPDAIEP